MLSKKKSTRRSAKKKSIYSTYLPLPVKKMNLKQSYAKESLLSLLLPNRKQIKVSHKLKQASWGINLMCSRHVISTISPSPPWKTNAYLSQIGATMLGNRSDALTGLITLKPLIQSWNWSSKIVPSDQVCSVFLIMFLSKLWISLAMYSNPLPIGTWFYRVGDLECTRQQSNMYIPVHGFISWWSI